MLLCPTNQAYQHAPKLNFFAKNTNAGKMTMPWIDCQHHFSGIPLHGTALHDLMVVLNKQQLLVDQFIDKMGMLLDYQGIKHGGAWIVQTLQKILGNELNDICV
ncbi:hypothetical protein ACA910_007139 [Epithemia clementina (nom. ined.)]